MEKFKLLSMPPWAAEISDKDWSTSDKDRLKKGQICRNWVDSRGLIFQNFMKTQEQFFKVSIEGIPTRNWGK